MPPVERFRRATWGAGRMICHEFKGGIGTSSRVVDLAMHTYTVGVLVQANYDLVTISGSTVSRSDGRSH